MKKLILAISVFILFGSSLANAENGYVDLKFISKNNINTNNLDANQSVKQNLSGFGVAFYNQFLEKTDREKFVYHIEKSSLEKKIEKKLYEERKKGTRPKTIAKLENKLFIEREKRNKLMTKKYRVQTNPNLGGLGVRKIGLGIILGYKHLVGNAGPNTSVEENSAEIGIRINW